MKPSVQEHTSMSLEEAYRYCAALQHHYGKSYAFATAFFTKEQRKAVQALYAFFRIPDEIVDNPSSSHPQQDLDKWIVTWKNVLNGQATNDPVLRAASDVFKRYDIPTEYSDAFLSAMRQDCFKTRYDTYEELESYMYGSASVVGLMLTCIIGWSKPELSQEGKKAAIALGQAMQLTNFLRDIAEDWNTRRRIYLPREELAQFHLSEEDIMNSVVDERFIAFMKWQIHRIDRLYELANNGIHFLHPSGRLPVRIASDLYHEIVRKIEAQQYNVYKDRARTTLLEKLLLLFTSLRYV